MLNGFIKKFGIKKGFKDVLEIKGSYYLIKGELEEIQQHIDQKPFCGGIYLGKKKIDWFIPGMYVLEWLNKRTKQKITVDDNAAWLFVCRRDLFAQGIISDTSKLKKNGLVLVLNKEEECLGYGKIVQGRIFIKNMFDIGDFLRREKKK